MHTCTHAYIHIGRHKLMCVYTHMHVYIYTTSIHPSIHSSIHPCLPACLPACMHALHTHTHIHTYVHNCVHTYIYTYIHTVHLHRHEYILKEAYLHPAKQNAHLTLLPIQTLYSRVRMLRQASMTTASAVSKF